MDRITLHTYAISQSSEKVRWALDAAGIAYRERHLAPFVHGLVPFQGVIGPLSPMPVLEAGGETLTDSTRILRWLEAQYAPFPLVPPDSGAREEAYAWVIRFDRSGQHLLRVVYGELLRRRALALRLWGLNANPLQKLMLAGAYPLIKRFFVNGLGLSHHQLRRSQNMVERLITSLDRVVGSGRHFLVGDALSIADITAAAMLAPLACPEQHPVYCRRDYHRQMKGLLRKYEQRPAMAWVRGMYRYRGVEMGEEAMTYALPPPPAADAAPAQQTPEREAIAA